MIAKTALEKLNVKKIHKEFHYVFISEFRTLLGDMKNYDMNNEKLIPLETMNFLLFSAVSD